MLTQIERRIRRLLADRKFSEILTGSVWAMGARVVSTLAATGTSILIARAYGADAMGILAVVNSFLLLTTIFTVLGTDTSILRLIPEHTAKHSVTSAFHVYRKTQWFVAAISIVTGVAFFLASPAIAAGVFDNAALAPLFALASAFVVFRSLMLLNTSAVRGLRLIRLFAFMQLLPPVSMLALLGALTLLVPRTHSPVYAQLAAYALVALVGWWIVRRGFRGRMRRDDAVEPAPLRGILAISAPMLMTASMQFFIGETGVLMLGMFRTEEEVGYYAIAVRLAALTAFVIKAINSMAAPKFSELYHTGDIDGLLHVARKSSKLIFWTTAPVLAVLIVFGRPLIDLLYGAEFVVAYPAMVMLVLGRFISSISGATGMFMNMTGNEKVFRNLVAIATALILGLGLLLIPRHGTAGAAFAAMVSLAFWNVGALVYIKRKFGRSIGYLPGLR